MMGFAAAGFAVALASALIQYNAARQAGRAQAAQLRRNRDTAYQAATDAVLRGQTDEEMARRRGWQLQGAQRAAFGASGVDLTSGSPLNVISDTAALTEWDALTVRANAAREAWGYETQAVEFENQARAARTLGRMGAAGSLLGGTAQALPYAKEAWGKKGSEGP